jgi:ketosteroid isomerase-like protein
MRRLKLFSMTTLSLLAAMVFLGAAAHAQQQSDADKVKDALEAFHAALSARDIQKMEEAWAHDPDVMYIGPRDSIITVGWDAVKSKWENVFSFWTELKVTTQDGPHLHVNAGVAWANVIANVVGKPKNGLPVNGPTFESFVLVKRGERWLLASDSTSRVP